jgi:hypothetical protein
MSKTASHFWSAVMLAVATPVTLAGCTSGPTIHSDYDTSVDFSRYRTYGFESELGTDRAGYSTLITSHFKRSVSRQLEARGYRRAETDPDLLVNFYVSVGEQTDIRSSPSPTMGAGYYGYRYGLYTAWPAYSTDISTVTYKVGTANVDVIDARRRQLVWEGVAEGRIKDEALEDPGPAIDVVIAELFASYPATAGSPANASE